MRPFPGLRKSPKRQLFFCLRRLDSLAYSPFPLVVQPESMQGEAMIIGLTQIGFCREDTLRERVQGFAGLIPEVMNEEPMGDNRVQG